MDRDEEIAALAAVWARLLSHGEAPVHAPPGPVAAMLRQVQDAFANDSQALAALDRARHDGAKESADALAAQLTLHAGSNRGLAGHLLEYRALVEPESTVPDTEQWEPEPSRPSDIFQPSVPSRPVHAECRATAYWTGFTRFGNAMNTLIGTGALIAAAAVHNLMTSPALIIFGLIWGGGGVLGARLYKRTILEIVLDGDRIKFSSEVASFTIPAGDITKVSRPWADPQRMGHLYIRARSRGVIRTAPRMHGLDDLVIQLRRVNPEIKLKGPRWRR